MKNKYQYCVNNCKWLRKRIECLQSYNHRMRDINQCKDEIIVALQSIEPADKPKLLYEYVPMYSDLEANIRCIEMMIVAELPVKDKINSINNLFDSLKQKIDYDFKLKKITKEAEYEVYI